MLSVQLKGSAEKGDMCHYRFFSSLKNEMDHLRHVNNVVTKQTTESRSPRQNQIYFFKNYNNSIMTQNAI